MTGAAKHAAILSTLERHGIHAAGFPAGKFIDDATGRSRLQSWSNSGHLIGNHTYSHEYYGGRDPVGTIADIDRTAVLVSGYPTSRPLFRFPYLAEGKTAEARDALRAALHARGLANAHVTIDTSDWYINSRMVERLKREPDADLTLYKGYYLNHLFDRATFYDQLAHDVTGRTIPHTILLHHNLTTALFLDAALLMLRERGWKLIDAATAFADPLFAAMPDIAPAGQSLVWQLAKAHGGFEDRLRSPGEDDVYEKPAMDRLQL